MRSRTLLILLTGVLACQPTSGEPKPSWPSFHGSNRDNKSTETGLLKQWPDGGPKLLWTFSGLGKGYSSVTVAGGLVYTSGMLDKETYVFALDLDGREKWRKRNGASWETTMSHAIRYTGSRATPTYDNGWLYHAAERGHLTAFDARTGREHWRVDLFKTFDAKVPSYGITESVLIDGDRLIVCPGGKKGYIVCLDKKTGKTIWANTEIRDKLGYASPVIAPFGGIRQILDMTGEAVFAVDAANGKLLWRVPHENIRGNSATDPIFHNGHVFASTGYGKGSILVRLEAAGGTVRAKTVWSSALMDNHHGGVVLLDGHLYGAGDRSKGWFCLDFMTGKQIWNAPGKGSITYADGMLYCLEERGTTKLVEATPEAYRLVSSFVVPKGGSGLHWAHPVVCDGRLYVRHADKLFAYDIRAK